MDRNEDDTPAAPHSSTSIKILQERFKQLQRNRAKREERELLDLFSGDETRSSGVNARQQTQGGGELHAGEGSGEASGNKNDDEEDVDTTFRLPLSLSPSLVDNVFRCALRY